MNSLRLLVDADCQWSTAKDTVKVFGWKTHEPSNFRLDALKLKEKLAC